MSEPGEELSRVPTDALVVLVGPAGAGKSSWAARWFRADQVVASDALRALVGTGEDDQRAGTDAFAVLDDVIERRLKRGLLTVVDSLGFDDDRRTAWTDLARTHARPAVAVFFATPAKDCRAANKARPHPVPSKALTAQLSRREEVRPLLDDEFDDVLEPTPAVVVPKALAKTRGTSRQDKPAPATAKAESDKPAPATPGNDSAAPATPGNREPAPATAKAESDKPAPATPGKKLSFGLHVSSFSWPGESAEIGPRLAEIAANAEAAGFDRIWVMDHLLQIPQVGREWEPMLEAYTTLGYLAAATRRVRLGTLVTAITHRNVALLAKTVATLDVLSSGRAECGLGIAWWEREHSRFGLPFPPVAERYELLEDALDLLPLMWGPGSPDFEGRRLGQLDTTCYPRPVQEKIPVLIGGSGPERTLRLVAERADACNLFGEPGRIAELVEILHRHCAEVGRDPAEIRVTQLSNVIAAATTTDLNGRIDALRGNATKEQFLESANAGLVEHHVERFEALAEAGVHEVMVRLGDIGHPDTLDAFGLVVDAFA